MVPLIFQKISIWVILIPFLIGTVNYKGLNKDSRWIFFLVLVAIPPQILTAFLSENNPWLSLSYNLYTPIEFSVLFIIFLSKLSAPVSRLITQVTAVLFLFCYLVALILGGWENRFLNEFVCAGNVICMLWILLLLQQEYGADETMIVKDDPFTWYLVAFSLYAPGRVATMALYHYIRNPLNPVRINLSLIDSVFNILLYLLFSIGLLIRKT